MNLFRKSSSLPRFGKLPTGKPAVISVLDVGSSKICCMIARLRPCEDSSILPGRSHKVEVLGMGYQRSQGIKSGVVVDMEAAERAIRLAIDSAERESNMTVDSLIVSVSAGRISSQTFSSDVDLFGREVRAADISAVLAAGYNHCKDDERETLHALPIGYTLDGEQNISDPQSMVGNKLGVDMHVVSVDAAPIRNLELCINRAHLFVDGMVAAPYASGLAALVDDEARLGAACIDMGAGTTTISIFLNGNLVFADAVAVGGNHVTMDLARCFSIRVNDAERLKVLHGTASVPQSEHSETLTIPSIEDAGPPVQMTVAQCAQVIRPRVEETFEMVRERINRSGFANVIGRRVVLTGGASQLSNVSDVASSVLDANVRLGRPLGISGLPNNGKGPGFSAAAGMMIFPQVASNEFVSGLPRIGTLGNQNTGTFARMGRWVRESF